MRALLITWMLICSSIAFAFDEEPLVTPTYRTSPFQYTDSGVARRRDAICVLRAKTGAYAHMRAKSKETTLEKELAIWDEAIASGKAVNFNAKELAKVRKIVVLAFQAVEKFPSLTSNDFGDFVYATCKKEKQYIQAKFNF